MDYIQEVKDLIFNSKTVLVNSVDESGFPISRAMLTVDYKRSLKEMYFSTNTSSNKVSQFTNNNKSSLYFYNDEEFNGVMLKGYMEVIHDKAIKDDIWEDGDEVYYPKGINDPDYCIIKFKAISGAYYKSLKHYYFDL